MEDKHTLSKLVSNYQLRNPGQQFDLELLISFLHRTDDAGLTDRKNFDGHLTASAFVLNSTNTAVLLLHHKKLNRWLQPGGHIDNSDDTLESAAKRETCEESGLKRQNLLPFYQLNEQHIFDIDSHLIPANINKSEPAHYHHDIRFLFTCANEAVLQLNANEALGFKWVPLTTLFNDETFGKVAYKLLQAISGAESNEATGKMV